MIHCHNCNLFVTENTICPGCGKLCRPNVGHVETLKPLSDCCRAEVKVYTEDEGTCFYYCTKCDLPCDASSTGNVVNLSRN